MHLSIIFESCSKGAVLRQKSVLRSTTHNFHLQPKQELGQVSHLLVCDFTYSLGPCSYLFSCVGMRVVVLVAVLCVCYWPLVFQRPLVRKHCAGEAAGSVTSCHQFQWLPHGSLGALGLLLSPWDCWPIGCLLAAELCLSCCCLPAEHQKLEIDDQSTR